MVPTRNNISPPKSKKKNDENNNFNKRPNAFGNSRSNSRDIPKNPSKSPPHQTYNQNTNSKKKIINSPKNVPTLKDNQNKIIYNEKEIDIQNKKVWVQEEQLRTVSTNKHHKLSQNRNTTHDEFYQSDTYNNNNNQDTENNFQMSKDNFQSTNKTEQNFLTNELEKYKLENYHIKNVKDEFEIRKKESDEKQERVDHYWMQRIKSIEDVQSTERQNLNNIQLKHNLLETEKQVQFEENIKLRSDNQNYEKNSSDSKQKLSDLENKLSDLVYMNNKLIGEKDANLKENIKGQDEIKIIRGTNEELKNLLKEKENHNFYIQKDNLKTIEVGVRKIEEQKSSEEQFLNKIKFLEDQQQKLKDKNHKLEENENVRETTFREHQLGFQEQLAEKTLVLERDSDFRVKDMEMKWENVILEKERIWKHNVDKLEEEFSYMITTLNDKHKSLNNEYSIRCEEIDELKEGLKLSLSRNKDLEDMIDQMSSTLIDANKEIEQLIQSKNKNYDNNGQDLENLQISDKKKSEEQKKSNKIKNELQEEIKALEVEVQEKKKEISEKGRECYDLRLNLEEQQDVVRRIEEKFKVYEQRNCEEFDTLKLKFDDQLDDINFKNKLLEERNRELESAKLTILNKNGDIERFNNEKSDIEVLCKEKIECLELDLERLRGKYNKKNELLDEYEEKLVELQSVVEIKDNEIETVNEELKSKGSIIENCIDEINNLKVNEDNKGSQKDEKIIELENLLENIEIKLDEKNFRVSELEDAIVEIDNACNHKTEAFEKKELKFNQEIRVKDNEIKLLIKDIERQKVKTKEGIENFQKFFCS